MPVLEYVSNIDTNSRNNSALPGAELLYAPSSINDNNFCPL